LQKLFSIFKLVFLLIILFCFSIKLRAENFHIIFTSLKKKDSLQISKFTHKIDPIKSEVRYPDKSGSPDSVRKVGDETEIFINFNKNYFSDSKEAITIFNPRLFTNRNLGDTCDIKHIRLLSSNVKVQSDSIHFDFYPQKIINISDSLKLGIISFVTPDFPHLYPEYSRGLSFRFDIFFGAKELVAELKNKDVDCIISCNYLGDYFDNELCEKVPEIDFVFDCFQENFDKSSQLSNYKNPIIHLNLNEFNLIKINFTSQDSATEFLKIRSPHRAE